MINETDKSEISDEVNEANAIRRIGLGQRLVKAWQLPHPVYRASDPKVCTHIYLHPTTGLFYARIPENDEGVLYASDRMETLRHRVLAALGRPEEVPDDRVWEPRLRIFYGSKHPRHAVAGWPQGESTILSSGYPHTTVPNVTPCVMLGALTFMRYERARIAGEPRLDIRELEIDFKARVERHRNLPEGLQDSHSHTTPTRFRARWWADPGSGDRTSYRDLPYSDAVWDNLTALTARFAALDESLRDYFLKLDTDSFLQRLQGPGLPLLTGPSKP